MQDAQTPSAPTPAGPPPGYYPDPNDASRLRRWDGSDWTDEYQARAPEVETPSPATPETEGVSAIVPLGYLAALFLPVVGVVLGIVAMYSQNRKNRPHGVAILMLSIVVAVVAVLVLTGTFSGPPAGVDCDAFPEYC